jgi:hypothetical protein
MTEQLYPGQRWRSVVDGHQIEVIACRSALGCVVRFVGSDVSTTMDADQILDGESYEHVEAVAV